MAEIKKVLRKKDFIVLAGIVILMGILLFGGTGINKKNKSSDVREIAHACKNLENRETCYAKAFENLTEATDRDYAFEILRELQRIEPSARGCHFIAHAISTTETRKDPSKWKELMNSAPQDCSYGAAHGALEVYASTFPDGKLPKKDVSDICNNPDTNNCTHILGHLLLVMNEDDIEESVKDCQSLPNDNLGKFECLTGVFMERITALNLEVHGLATKEALNWAARVPELEMLCRTQTGTESVACWKEIVHVVLIKVRNASQKLVDFCETAPGDEETRQCIDHALGIIASSYNFELAKMKPICETHSQANDFKNRCYAHLVSATISTVPQEIPSAVRFCNSINSDYQEDCFVMLGNSLYHVPIEYKAVLTHECASAPREFRQKCEFGGNSSIKFYTGD
jgi:hypothetical protein